MNREQRRRAAKRGNPYQAAQAQMENDLRKALKESGVELVSVAAATQNEETRVIVQVRRGDTTVMMSSPPKTVKGLVAGILHRLDHPDGPVADGPDPITGRGETQGPEPTVEAQRAPARPITASTPGNGPAYTDLSKYLEE